jgi:hypothetical protein
MRAYGGSTETIRAITAAWLSGLVRRCWDLAKDHVGPPSGGFGRRARRTTPPRGLPFLGAFAVRMNPLSFVLEMGAKDKRSSLLKFDG